MHTAFTLALAVTLLLGCTGCRDDAREHPPDARRDGGSDVDAGADEVLTEYRFTGGGPRQLEVGGDCSQGGPAACASGTCLKVRPGYGQGYVCSRACGGDGECPASWRCRALYPGAPAQACFPAAGGPTP